LKSISASSLTRKQTITLAIAVAIAVLAAFVPAWIAVLLLLLAAFLVACALEPKRTEAFVGRFTSSRHWPN
jgi:chromate transport protein ChrA